MSATNVARAGKRGNICVGNNVSATMCPRLPVLLQKISTVHSTSVNPKTENNWSSTWLY